MDGEGKTDISLKLFLHLDRTVCPLTRHRLDSYQDPNLFFPSGTRGSTLRDYLKTDDLRSKLQSVGTRPAFRRLQGMTYWDPFVGRRDSESIVWTFPLL